MSIDHIRKTLKCFENSLFSLKILENTFQGKLRALRVSRGLFQGILRENKRQ